MPNPEIPVLFVVLSVTVSVLTVVVSLLILWAVIRGAVLSALRKHHDETHGAATPAGYQRQQ
jgi:hypothetical protein